MSQWQKKDWREFEFEVAALMKAFGYKAEAMKGSHDYGVDVVASNPRRKVVVQCKLYGGARVGGDVIMQLLGSKVHHEATDAICVTNTYFTKQALEIAARNEVKLIDEEMLLQLCRNRSLTIPSLTFLAFGKRHHPTTDPQITFGREASCTIILDDPRVSRRHAELKRENLILQIRDLNSSNGTYLNGVKLTQAVSLRYGDKLKLGSVELEVVMKHPRGVLQTPSSR